MLGYSSRRRLRRVYYRVWQFWHSLGSQRLSDDQWAEIGEVLDEAELDLFARQTASNQRHGYRVLKTLKTAGQSDLALLKAALLHDVGKTRARSFWWDRPLVVLFMALKPDLVRRWATGQTRGWSRPFSVKIKHPDWGAEDAGRAGSPALTVNLIRRHQEPLPDTVIGREERLLRLLTWADDRN